MAQISPQRGVPGSSAEGAGEVLEVNALTALLNEFNGNIDGTNVKSTAALTIASLITSGAVSATGTLSGGSLTVASNGKAAINLSATTGTPGMTARGTAEFFSPSDATWTLSQDVNVGRDLTVGDDLTVTDAASVGGALTVTGALQASDGTYRNLRHGTTITGPGVVAGTYVVQEGGNAATALAGTPSSILPFYFDPADYAITGKTTKLRVTASVGVGATAPGTVTFTVGLYPLTGPTAGSYVAGTVTSGSTAAFVNPGANASSQGNSGDFNAPAAGYYALAVASSATTAGGSVTGLRATLQLRHV